MDIQIDYGELYYGSVLNYPETILDLRSEPVKQYLIMPIEKYNRFFIKVYDFQTGCTQNMSIRHFKFKNFVRADSFK